MGRSSENMASTSGRQTDSRRVGETCHLHPTDIRSPVDYLPLRSRVTQQRGEDEGLSPDGFAFYDAFGRKRKPGRVDGNEPLRMIAHKLLVSLKGERDSGLVATGERRARLRVLVKHASCGSMAIRQTFKIARCKPFFGRRALLGGPLIGISSGQGNGAAPAKIGRNIWSLWLLRRDANGSAPWTKADKNRKMGMAAFPSLASASLCGPCCNELNRPPVVHFH